MPPQPAPAPVASLARQVDLARHPLPDQRRIVRLRYLGNELVPRCARESVIPALQFQIGIADASQQQTQQRETLRPLEPPHVAHRHLPAFQMNRQHALYNRASCLRNLLVSKSGAARGFLSPKSSTIAPDAAACWKRCTASPRSPPKN